MSVIKNTISDRIAATPVAEYEKLTAEVVRRPVPE